MQSNPGQHIGAIRLAKDEKDNRGFWLGLRWQGKGLMTEAVMAANDYWFDVLGFPVLRTSKAMANIESRRIFEKTGMSVVASDERDYLSGRMPAGIWEITAARWREQRLIAKNGSHNFHQPVAEL